VALKFVFERFWIWIQRPKILCSHFSLLSLYWKSKDGVMRSPSSLYICVSMCLCVSFSQRLNVWINLYENWYVYHGNWANFNVVLHKWHPSVCVFCIYASFFVATQRLRIHIPAEMNILVRNKEEFKRRKKKATHSSPIFIPTNL
jgi:hypothetical protein